MRKYYLLAILAGCGMVPGLTEAGDAGYSDRIRLNLVPDWQMLASNGDADNRAKSSASQWLAEPADEPIFTPNKLHKYLGLGSLGLAALAIIAPKPEDEDGRESKSGIHHNLAVGATVLGAAAVGTGFTFHLDDIDLRNGFRDPDNLHLLLALLGEAGLIAAVSAAPDSGHAALGALGAVSMVAAIKIEW